MNPLSRNMLQRLRDRLIPAIRRTAEDVVLEVIERKGIPSRSQFRQTLAEVEEKSRIVESASEEIDALLARAPGTAQENQT